MLSLQHKNMHFRKKKLSIFTKNDYCFKNKYKFVIYFLTQKYVSPNAYPKYIRQNLKFTKNTYLKKVKKKLKKF